MTVKVIGLDIAKNVFQVHGVNEAGEVVVRRKLRRSDVLRWFAEIDPVGVEACQTAHYWARELVARLRAPPVSLAGSSLATSPLVQRMHAVDRSKCSSMISFSMPDLTAGGGSSIRP